MGKSVPRGYVAIPEYEETEEELTQSSVSAPKIEELRELVPNAFSNVESESDVPLVDSTSQLVADVDVEEDED